MARTRTASKPSTVDLAKAVLKALQPGDGRVYPCPRNELPDRLAEDGVADHSGLDDALAGLWDVGQIILTQRNSGYPVFICGQRGTRAPCRRCPGDEHLRHGQASR